MEEQDGEQRARGMMARMRELEHGPEQRMRDTFFRVHQLLTRQESLHSERWHLKREFLEYDIEHEQIMRDRSRGHVAYDDTRELDRKVAEVDAKLQGLKQPIEQGLIEILEHHRQYGLIIEDVRRLWLEDVQLEQQAHTI